MRFHAKRAGWRFARDEDLPALDHFLRAREHACVAFTAQLRRGGEITIPPKLRERVVLYESSHGELQAAILHASTGFVLPVFHDEITSFPRPASRVLMPLRHPPLLFGAVMGRTRDVALFRSIVSPPPRDEMVYHLMWRPVGNSPAPATHPDLERIRRAEPEDFNALLPLQEAYEKEEVLLPGRRLNARIVEHNLRTALQEQLILIGENTAGPIAKVATNARGLDFDQVGGVFTLPRYRSRGVGRFLMQHLIREVGRQGRATTLFVKKHNKPALAMYAALDYQTAEDFSIIYYR
jgi:hypothetical protein